MILNRAKSIYSDEYIISKDIKFELGLMYLRVNEKWRECEKDTRSINFPDMIDAEGNKIFTSLSPDGKGGDKIIEDGKYEDGFNAVFKPYFRKSSFSIEDLPQTPYGQYELHKYKVIGIQE